MEQLRRESIDKIISKESRWDRIRKKHINTINFTSRTINKMMRMQFIKDKEVDQMNGKNPRSLDLLDPVLVMNIRHSAIKRRRQERVAEQSIAADQRSNKMEKLNQHNCILEKHYIDHEINKFQTQIRALRPKRMNTAVEVADNIKCQPLDNTAIFENVFQGQTAVQDFYNHSIKASIDNELLHESDPQSSGSFSEDEIEKNSIKELTPNIQIQINPPLTDLMTSTSEEMASVKKSLKAKVTHIEMIGKTLNISPKSPPNQITTQNNYDVQIQTNDENELIKISNFVKQKEALEVKRIEHPPTFVPPQDRGSQFQLQDTIISQLFETDQMSKEMQLMVQQKYFLKWIHHTTISKISKQHTNSNEDRVQKINAFLDQIRQEKNRLKNSKKTLAKGKFVEATVSENSIMMARKFQNKLKIQQDIIELQKMKLERQEHLITELRVSRIAEEAKKSKDTIKEELKNVVKHGSIQNKLKAKCLQVVANMRDEEDEEEAARMQAKGLIMPKFLVEMQARALDRERKHELARERRAQLEKEREDAKLAAEEAKRLEDEEEKRQRLEAMRQKRKIEKMAKIIKERERQKYLDDCKRATEFYQTCILRRLGIDRFKMLIQLKRLNERKSKEFRRRMYLRNCLRAWAAHVDNVWLKKRQMADAFYIKCLTRYCIISWKDYYLVQQSKWLVAIDLYEYRLGEKVIRAWHNYTGKQKLITEVKMVQAESHHNWQLKWKVLDHWRRLRDVLKIERETELRRERWRIKIWELLPDYTPNAGAFN